MASETAKEYTAEDGTYGVMTYCLTRQLSRAAKTKGPAPSSYRDIMDLVQKEVHDIYTSQFPQIVGRNSDKYLFGNQVKISTPYILASPSVRPGMASFPYAGVVAGVTSGSVYDVYAPGTALGGGVKPVAQVQASTVRVDGSDARILSGGPIAEGSRAVLKKRDFGNRTLRIALKIKSGDTVLPALRSALAKFPYIKETPTPQIANLVVSEEVSSLRILTPDGTPLSEKIEGKPAERALSAAAQVVKWANWFFELAQENPDSSLKIDLTLTHPKIAGDSRDVPLKQIGPADLILREGQAVVATITNRSTVPVYVYVLVLSSDRSIEVLFPPPNQSGSSNELEPGKPLPLTAKATLPSCLNLSKDSIKVIATTTPLQLTEYGQKGICDSVTASGGYDQLVHARNLDLVKTVSDWVTIRKVLEIQK